jgi:Na+/glutamate symporter
MARGSVKLLLPLWQRLLIIIVAMLTASYLAGHFWHMILGFALPSYGAGLVGGLTAIPLWDFLQRVRPQP